MESGSIDEASPGVVTHDWWAVLTLGIYSDCQPTDCDDDDGCGMLAATTSSNATGLGAMDDNHFNWQLALCNKLQQGPFEVLNSAKHCKIAYSQRAPLQAHMHLLPSPLLPNTRWSTSRSRSASPSTTRDLHCNFLANCIMNGFNLVNDAAYSYADSIEIDSEGGLGDIKSATQEDSANQLRGRVAMTAREFVVTTQMRFSKCRACKALDSCDPDNERRHALEDSERDEFLNNLAAEALPAWETAVCNLLRGGAFEVFSRAENYTIERGAVLARIDEDDEEANPVVATDDDMVEETKDGRISVKIHVQTEFSAAERAFIGNTAMIAYNEIHDPSISSVGAVHLDQEQSQNSHLKSSPTATLQFQTLEELLSTFSFSAGSGDLHAICAHPTTATAPSTDLGGFTVSSLGPVRAAFLESVEAGSHETWEESICNKLRNGSFDRLSQSTECKVIFDSPTIESE